MENTKNNRGGYERIPSEQTQYILSLSYGKDSLACLEAIKQLGLPLDRIIHASLRHNYPNLWRLLLKWDVDSPTIDYHTVHDYDKRFQMEDEGLLTAGDRKFRWKMVEEYFADRD